MKARVNIMAKQPSKQEVKIPQASKKTRDAIAFFNDKKPATALIEEPDGRKTRKLQYVGHVKTANEKFFDFIEDRKFGSYLALGITAAVVIAVVYWMMHQ
jgi:hypothetical protein